MAETVKILSPKKRVFLPNKKALCPMAAMIDLPKLQKLKIEKPRAKVIAYVNTTAETKVLIDVCVTSANAVKICEKIDDEIIFLPDQNLGEFIREKLPHKKITILKGFCEVHQNFNEEKFHQKIASNRDAKVLLHPEVPRKFDRFADEVLSTGGMLKFVAKSHAKKFLIGTENSMCERLKMEFPDREFIPLLDRFCAGMQKTNLQNIYETLRDESGEISLDKKTISTARKSLQKMLEFSLLKTL